MGEERGLLGGDVMAQLGIAVPLVAILLYILRQTNEERQRITSDFLMTLRETVSSNTNAMAQISGQIASQTAAIEGVNRSFRERATLTSKEHQEIVEALDRVIFQMEIETGVALPAGTRPRNTPRTPRIAPPPEASP